MCKVYEFPKQLELPKEEAELIEILGEAYVKALYAALVKMIGYDGTCEEMEVIGMMVNKTFTEGMIKAIEDLEES